MSHLTLNWKLESKKEYKLRDASLKKRVEVEHRKKEPKKRGPKPRPKAQPMSKYRRKAANLRERQRMGEINVAFEKLREKIPTPVQIQNSKCEKMTKINILHVAINYIRALQSIMETGDAGIQIYGTSVVQSPDLPIHPESEIMEMPEKPIKNNPQIGKKPKIIQTRTKNPSSSSSNSEDSGIGNLSEESEDQSEETDWTELHSTLELFPSSRGNLDTLLSSTSCNSQKILQAKDLNNLDLDLFNDLNSSFDSLNNEMIPFEEDPFELVF